MEVSASMDGAGGLGLGKLRVTTERFVFERKKMFGGAGDVTSFPLSSIQAAGISGVLEKKLKVRAGSTELVFKSGLSTNSDADLKAISNLLQRSIAGQPLGTPMQSHGEIADPEPRGGSTSSSASPSCTRSARSPTKSSAWRSNLRISPSMLARRLTALTDAGLLERRRYSERPPRDEYVLTERGAAFRPVLHAIYAWSEEHVTDRAGKLAPVDRATGAAIDPILVDRATGTPLEHLDIAFTAGPNAGETMRARYARPSLI